MSENIQKLLYVALIAFSSVVYQPAQQAAQGRPGARRRLDMYLFTTNEVTTNKDSATKKRKMSSTGSSGSNTNTVHAQGYTFQSHQSDLDEEELDLATQSKKKSRKVNPTCSRKFTRWMLPQPITIRSKHVL